MVARGNPNDQYRGYGDSEDAKPCEEGFMKDARGALKAHTHNCGHMRSGTSAGLRTPPRTPAGSG